MKRKNNLPLWAGLSAFFSTVLTVGAINVFSIHDDVRFVSGLFVGAITGLTIYARQKMDDARVKRARDQVTGGEIKITNRGDKRIYSLELEGDPRELEHRQEVIFKVNKIDEIP